MKHTLCIMISAIYFCGAGLHAQTFWSPLPLPSEAERVFAIAFDRAGDLLVGGPGGVYRSADQGKNWKRLHTISTRAIAINTHGHIFLGLDPGMLRSIDNGDHWAPINTGLLNSTVHSLALTPNGEVFAGTSRGIFRSKDNGENWARVFVVLAGREELEMSADALAANAFGHIFACSNGFLYRSTNNGETWGAAKSAHGVTLDANGIIYAAANGFVSRSTDDGQTWVSSNQGLPNLRFTLLASHVNGHVFASSNIFPGNVGSGVFMSPDFGENWVEANSGLMDMRIQSLAVNAQGHVFAGTDSAGLFRSAQPITGVHQPEQEFLSSNVLLQNYPNPFNPSTTIRFELSKPERVTLSIHNLSGQTVRTLISGQVHAGSQGIAWDGANDQRERVTSGVYFYRLEAESFVAQKKLILLQ